MWQLLWMRSGWWLFLEMFSYLAVQGGATDKNMQGCVSKEQASSHTYTKTYPFIIKLVIELNHEATIMLTAKANGIIAADINTVQVTEVWSI